MLKAHVFNRHIFQSCRVLVFTGYLVKRLLNQAKKMIKIDILKTLKKRTLFYYGKKCQLIIRGCTGLHLTYPLLNIKKYFL